MKSFLFFIIVLVYSGCSKPENLTCASLQNEYKKYHYLKDNNQIIPIDTIVGKANKDLSRQVFLYDLKEAFQNNVSKYMRTTFYNYTLGQKTIEKPYLNRYCHQINFVMQHDLNQTQVEHKFKQLEQQWVQSYEINLSKDLENRLQFHAFNGCEENSRKWRNSFIRFSATPSSQTYDNFKMFKREYEDCLRGSKKAYQLQKDKEKQHVE